MGRAKRLRPTSVSVWEGADGKWHGYLTTGTKPDGSPDRKHRSAATRAECEAKIRALEDQATRGEAIQQGKAPTLVQWLTEWLAGPVAELGYQTRRTYRWAVDNHIVPGLGAHRMDRLTAGKIEGLYRALAEQGLSSSSVHTIHRVLRAALHEAARKGKIPKNPMDAVKSPKLDEDEVTPLHVDEVRKILAVAEGRRNGTRWLVGLSFGLRQGEMLGMPWLVPSDSTKDLPVGIDLDAGVIWVRTKAYRQSWEHGCKDPAACARPHCRTEQCPPSWEHGCSHPASCCTYPDRRTSSNLALTARGCPRRKPGPCRRHSATRGCPPLCPPGCTRHASHCPQRVNGGIVLSDPKSKAGRRKILLPPEITERLRVHRTAQRAERAAAGTAWEDHGLVWCQPNGRPIDAGQDRAEWRTILTEAGVRSARVHDGRHTSATMLLLLRVDGRTVMAIMGWSDGRMLQRYQHVVDELLAEGARRIGGLLFGDSATGGATGPPE